VLFQFYGSVEGVTGVAKNVCHGRNLQL